MKGGLAAAMVAAAALRWSRVRFRGRLLVAALVDEEGGMAGARHFMRTPLGQSVNAAIICEPEQNELCLEQKGVFWARVRVQGRMAHGAMPYAGANPIAAAGAFLALLPGLERRIRRGVPRSRVLGTAHVTPTVCRAPVLGAAQGNVIPSSAELTIDVRLVPGLAPRTVLTALRTLARRIAADRPGIRIDIDLADAPRPAVRTRRSEAVVKALEWAVATVTKRPPRFGGVPGSTDGTIFVAERRIPIVTFGPGGREVPHQVDEFVEVAELTEAARCYAAAAVRFFEAQA
jgi:succinyl-diaminopimelate desuccinylase